MRVRENPWKTPYVVAAGIALCAALAVVGAYAPDLLLLPGIASRLKLPSPSENAQHYPFLELMKLLVAGLLGMIVTAVHRYTRGKPQGSSIEHAQILLCVSGAIMMIIIGNSLARAFGVAGGASIIRFRTPVEDPKDALILFLLLALGMACGLAAFGLAILGTGFLCFMLLLLDRMAEDKPREMTLEVVAAGADFPADFVQGTLAARGIRFEPREVVKSEQAIVRYLATVQRGASLEEISAALTSHPDLVRSVSWIKPKKSALP